jgi:hypothetical protein
MRRDAEDDAKVRRQRHKLLLRLPLYDVLSELRAAAQRMHPNHMYMGTTRPVVAVKLELACPEPLERKRHGVATLKVGEAGRGATLHAMAVPCVLMLPAAELLGLFLCMLWT